MAHYLRAEVKERLHDHAGMCDDLSTALKLEPSKKFVTNAETFSSLMKSCHSTTVQTNVTSEQASQSTFHSGLSLNEQDHTSSLMKIMLMLLGVGIIFLIGRWFFKASRKDVIHDHYQVPRIKELTDEVHRYQQQLNDWLDGHAKRVLDVKIAALSHDQEKEIAQLNALQSSALQYQQQLTEYIGVLKNDHLPDEHELQILFQKINCLLAGKEFIPENSSSGSCAQSRHEQNMHENSSFSARSDAPIYQSASQAAPIIVQQQSSILDDVLKIAAIESLIHPHRDIERDVIIEREPQHSEFYASQEDDDDRKYDDVDLGDSSSDWSDSSSDSSSDYDSGSSSDSW